MSINNTNTHLMTIQQVHDLISNGESQTLEFKKSLSLLKAALETICAFLNTSGGIVLIGVNQSGKIIGQEITDNTQQEIAKEIAKIEPFPSTIKVQYLPLENQKPKQIVIILATRGETVPYIYDDRAYYRNQSSTMRMPQSQYSKLLLERGMQTKNSWENQLTDNVIDDLDHEEIQRTIKIAINANRIDSEALDEPIEDLLMRLDLISDHRLTNAAMVLFAKSVKPNFSQCLIKMARFRGRDELGGFIDNQMIHGNAFHIMKSANDFIMRHLPVASFFDEEKLERIDKPLLPVLAIREALSNAISHRDYSILNASINLAIFDDRMEIWNNGTLPSSLTLEDLKKKHKSYPRNKNIARVFYLRRYVETWGTGTTKMVKLCREHGLSDPIFDEYSGGFSVVFTFKDTIGATQLDNVSLYLLSDRQKEIYRIIQERKAIGLVDILSALEHPPSDRMVRKDLDTLRQQGLIRLEGHGKNAKWAINLLKNQ